MNRIKINFLKSKYRSRLTDAHLEDTFRFAILEIYKQLAQDHRCSFSLILGLVFFIIQNFI